MSTPDESRGTDRPRAGVAVVTGGSAGLGRAISVELARQGYDVAVLARGEGGLAGTVAEVEQQGRSGLAVPTDVADAGQVEAAATRVEHELGAVDVWVNNAMEGVFADFLDVKPEEYERVTAVTYLGTVNGTRAALSRMRPRERGHVVQVGSALAFRGIPLQAAYCGAKHAVVGFTESVITELRHEKSRVRVSMVHMPALNTMQFDWVRTRLGRHPQPVPPIYQPEVGARAVAHVVAHPKRTTWVGASTAGTILGNRFVPGLLDRYLGRTGVSGQLTDKDASDLGDNLDAPVPGDHGAHGDFDDEARAHSPQRWLATHRSAVPAAAAVVGAGGAVLVRALRRRG